MNPIDRSSTPPARDVVKRYLAALPESRPGERDDRPIAEELLGFLGEDEVKINAMNMGKLNSLIRNKADTYVPKSIPTRKIQRDGTVRKKGVPPKQRIRLMALVVRRVLTHPKFPGVIFDKNILGLRDKESVLGEAEAAKFLEERQSHLYYDEHLP